MEEKSEDGSDESGSQKLVGDIGKTVQLLIHN